jgi:hypothetical protein
MTSGRVADRMIDKNHCQIGGAPGVDIKPLVSLLLLPRRLSDFFATCANCQSASMRCPRWGSCGSRASNDRARQNLDQDAAKRDLIVPILPTS